MRDIDNHTVILRVHGEVDMLTTPVLVEQLRAAEALLSPPVPVLVDLTGVTFLASAGLSALVEYGERYAELGSQLRVVATDRAVIRPITVTGLHELLPVFPTEQEALQRFPG
ncbi:STAS domain-containing protein [Actinophytocola algeriensis]|uniref:Anti-sigma factor antagonist n=1 Tax=Actinophytocola algeriensis TaxID=1768010 RepID=A0A7W7QFK3_9PSEU|nr:STAS domain-containing protein [Actinophytocola algeriensis]MBB4912755.1 anti-anti-sigma factor [Actinophytocola algeriensis]MBE1473577.1 anti-anti-sigma factor [Actinophytocola algeriensis]